MLQCVDWSYSVGSLYSSAFLHCLAQVVLGIRHYVIGR
jgi:hypothetical protein